MTQLQLKSHLHYNPLTGVFTRLKGFKRWRAGDRVGSINSQGYIETAINHKRYYIHRLAFLYMTGAIPEFCGEKIPRIGLL